MIMIFWIARDKDGELYLYNVHPKKQGEFFACQFGYRSMQLGICYLKLLGGIAHKKLNLN